MKLKIRKIINVLVVVFALASAVGLAYPLLASVSFPSTIVVPGANTFQIADTNYLQGGHMQFTATSSALGLALRNAITPERRTTGMLVTVSIAPTATSTQGSTTYRLVSNRPTGIANDNSLTGCATSTSQMVTDGSLDGKPAGVPAASGKYSCPTLTDMNWAVVIPSLDSTSLNSYLRVTQDVNGNYVVGIGSGASSTTSTGVTSVTVGDLAPLFTTSVGGTPGVNPSFTFTLTTQLANKVFASPDGTGGAPIFRSLTPRDIASTSTATSGSILVGNGTNFNEVTLSGDATVATSGVLTLKTIPGIAGAYSGAVTGLTIDTSGRVTAIATSTSGGSGLASVGSTDNSITLTLGGGGTTLNGVLNLANPNSWTGLQGFAVSSTATSGTVHGLEISPVYNQTASTASNTDLFINRNDTGGVGSGSQLLVDAQVDGVSKFKVDTVGNVTFSGGFNAAGTSTLSGAAYTGANAGLLYTNGSGTLLSLAIPSTSACKILHAGSTLTFGCVDLSVDVGATILGVANGGLGAAVTPTVGGILYSSNGTSFTNLSLGTQGQILTASGTGPVWSDNQGGWATVNGSFAAAGWGSISALGGSVNTVAGGTSTTLNQWLYSYFFPASKPTVALTIALNGGGYGGGQTLETGASTTTFQLRATITKNTNNIATLAMSANNSATVCSVASYAATGTQPCAFTTPITTTSGSTISGIAAGIPSSVYNSNTGSVTFTATVADSAALSNSGTVAISYLPKVYAFLSSNTSYLTAATSTVNAAILANATGNCTTLTTSTGCYTMTGSISGTQFNAPASANGYILYVAMPQTTYDTYSACYNSSSTPCIKVSSDGTTPSGGDGAWGRRVIGITNAQGFTQNYSLYAYKASSDTVAYTSDLSNYKVKF